MEKLMMNIKTCIIVVLLLYFNNFSSSANNANIDIENEITSKVKVNNDNIIHIAGDDLVNQISRDWILYKRSLNDNKSSTCLAN